MAVYTDVSDDDLEAFLEAYDVGELVSFKGIAEGVENTNFLVITANGTYIRIRGTAELHHRDTFRIGDQIIRLRLD